MRVEVALCQMRPAMGNPEKNAKTVADLVGSDPADVLVFPESFLTGYGERPEGLSERIGSCLSELSDLCRREDKAVALGTARMSPEGARNSIAFLSPDGDVFYDKTHLARFGIYAEDGYVGGSGPVMGRYHGIGFGLSICYDIYFPEVLRPCSLSGADVNICVSAAAVPSAPFFDRILPARALENVSYLAFVNNVGPMAGLDMAGQSRIVDPFGCTVASLGHEEGIIRFTADTEEIAEMRTVRRHLTDFRRDVDWHLRGARPGPDPCQDNLYNGGRVPPTYKPRWPSPVRREPGKLVGTFPREFKSPSRRFSNPPIV